VVAIVHANDDAMKKRGFEVLRDKTLNQSIAFGRSARDRLGLRGLLPYEVATPRQMVQRVMTNLERLPRTSIVTCSSRRCRRETSGCSIGP
jgi:hypothetical protein